ncbi:MAG TPA: Abi family protein [Puia sp.]|nr:Abi family protein [Puia sp.]
MKFTHFQDVMSIPRMSRYVTATMGNSRKAMTLYRLNLRLSQELFTVISCFEVALRNRIDQHYSIRSGNDWLRDSALPGGMFNNRHCGKTPYIISEALRKLSSYTHPKLVAEMDFGFWRYTFARHQFFAGGQSLLAIFPAKPISTRINRYDHNYVFAELEKINIFRNRIAHHEPVCFLPGHPFKDTTFSRNHYLLIRQLFQWMQIDEAALLYGIDHITNVLDDIDGL